MLDGWPRAGATNREPSHVAPPAAREAGWDKHGMVINGILFGVRAGVPWCDPPERYGSGKTVHERHRRWPADGAWDRILQVVLAEPIWRAGSTGA